MIPCTVQKYSYLLSEIPSLRSSPPLSLGLPFLCLHSSGHPRLYFEFLVMMRAAPGRGLWLVSSKSLTKALQFLKTLQQTSPTRPVPVCANPPAPAAILELALQAFQGLPSGHFPILRFIWSSTASFFFLHRRWYTGLGAVCGLSPTYWYFRVCGKTWSTDFLVNVVHGFLFALSYLFYFCGKVTQRLENCSTIAVTIQESLVWKSKPLRNTGTLILFKCLYINQQ